MYLKVKNNIPYLYNYDGKSGIPLGGIGTGSFEYTPGGHFRRLCLNNIHLDSIKEKGCFIALHEKGKNAIRLQLDNINVFGMKGVRQCNAESLFPRQKLFFKNLFDEKISATVDSYSSLVPRDLKNSCLPVAHFVIEVNNKTSENKEFSLLFSFANLIGKGIRDTFDFGKDNFNELGDSSSWFYRKTPCTIFNNSKIINWVGSSFSLENPSDLIPSKITLQNYNDDFSIYTLNDDTISISSMVYKINDGKEELNNFVINGTLDDNKINRIEDECLDLTHALAVNVKFKLASKAKKTVKIALLWHCLDFTCYSEKLNGVSGCNYGKYYQNYFENKIDLYTYCLKNFDKSRKQINKWHNEIISCSIPEWLKFKILNSSYTLLTNSILNKKGNYSNIEGSNCMGGLGGTLDQRMNAQIFYKSFYNKLGRATYMQFSNNLGKNNEVLHFDLNYYHGMLDYDYKNDYFEKQGSMLCNSAAFIIHMFTDYIETMDRKYFNRNYKVFLKVMEYLNNSCDKKSGFPLLHTTYDDQEYPDNFIYSGILYSLILEIGIKISEYQNDEVRKISYINRKNKVDEYIDKLFINNEFYCIGANKDFSLLFKDVLFIQCLAGQFLSRTMGLSDIVNYSKGKKTIYTILKEAVQNSKNYLASKSYDMLSKEGIDLKESYVWPFMLDTYVGLTSIYYGYVNDGLNILKSTLEENYDSGYLWSQNIWYPNNVTYMTSMCGWYTINVLCGASLNLIEKSLTLGIHRLKGEDKIRIVVYYPLFSFVLKYSFSENKGNIMINEVYTTTILSNKTLIFRTKGYNERVIINLDNEFLIKRKSILDLSVYSRYIYDNSSDDVVIKDNLWDKRNIIEPIKNRYHKEKL